MKFIKGLAKVLKNMLPTPFPIAFILTAVTFILALTLTSSRVSGFDRVVEVMGLGRRIMEYATSHFCSSNDVDVSFGTCVSLNSTS